MMSSAKQLKEANSARNLVMNDAMKVMSLRDSIMSSFAEQIKQAKLAFNFTSGLSDIYHKVAETSKNDFAELIENVNISTSQLSVTLKNNKIGLNDNDYQIDEVHTDVSAVVKGIAPEENIFDALERIEKKIDEIKRPSIYKDFLKQFFQNLVISIIVALLMHFYITKGFATNKQQVIKMVQSSITLQNYDSEVRKNLRIVTAEELIIKACKNRRSRIVGNLYLGQVVEVAKKERKWVRVELKDIKGNVLIRGWVSNRHLKRIAR